MSRLRPYVTAQGRAVVLVALAVVEVAAQAVMLGSLVLGFGLGLLFLFPWGVAGARAAASAARALTGRWTGRPIPEPYLPAPPHPRPGPDGRYRHLGISYRSPALPEFFERVHRLLSDRATWRDTLWLVADPVVGLAMAALPLIAVGYGLFGMALPLLWDPSYPGDTLADYAGVEVASQDTAVALVPVGAAFLALGLWAGPRALALHARWTRTLLAPARASELALQVAELDEKRNAATDWQAAEVRRIERDLHDGPQARLVALGMTVSAAEELVDDDPAAAKVLLRQAQESSSAVLRELRGLVRGIHPPVLAERGLGDAVRALALDSALDVRVEVDLRGGLPDPVQSAAYFAVAEILANAGKHAGADRVDIDLWHRDGVLRATVTDDGRGGAVPTAGGGLRGVERRLRPFDGVLAVSSPEGGPTTVAVEIPCPLGEECCEPEAVGGAAGTAAGARGAAAGRGELWLTALAPVLCSVALVPQGLVAGVLLIFGTDNRSWFLALYMPEALRWPTALAMVTLGLAGLPPLLRRWRKGSGAQGC
ncbi:sensor domain-containing protein [Streptomyces sp. WMMC500]|uniref:sensor histidine kinase n=1 Tax=Streptomyces sp. WMMC500 TaxID=3015154 RepID=UPI00248CC145|nr:sensor domain-containing protein [Streptomyces sp. WMMC500]WBB62683.1 sensor domain-containing protein [Streptomyces sp. WMMC500]